MLIWCLKQYKNFLLKLSISGSFFSENKFLVLYTTILVSFPLGGCVDEVVDNQTNDQRYTYAHLLYCHTLTVLHFMNGE